METTQDTFTIGQLAEKTGLTRRALRLYEQASLLVPLRDENNYRRYTEQHLKEALIIRDLRVSGLSIQTIRQIIDIKRTDCEAMQKFQGYLDVLDTMQAELIARRQVIDRALEQVKAYRGQVMSWIEHEQFNEEE
jgi:DNA-binding transcriptional MerR regulator